MRKVLIAFFLFCNLLVATPIFASENTHYYMTREIEQRSDILEWRYKIINGRLYKRLYNKTKNKWVGDWITA